MRPATPERSFGWRRAEVLAALANALVLVLLGGWIVWAAIGRLSDPPGVVGGWVLQLGLPGSSSTSPQRVSCTAPARA